MSPEQYMKERVDKQIDWYLQRSASNLRWHKRTRIVEIICAAGIPLFAGSVLGIQYGGLVVALLGVVIAVSAGLASTYRYQENSTTFRTTYETLMFEKFLFLTRSGMYASEDSFGIFVQHIESALSRENASWASSSRRVPAPMEERFTASPSNFG